MARGAIEVCWSVPPIPAACRHTRRGVGIQVEGRKAAAAAGIQTKPSCAPPRQHAHSHAHEEDLAIDTGAIPEEKEKERCRRRRRIPSWWSSGPGGSLGSRQAIATVVTVAEILKNNGLAVEKKIMTSTVDVNDDSRSRPMQKAKIEIVLGKTENFDELMAAAAEEREVAAAEEGEEQS